MRIMDFLDQDAINVDLKAKTKPEVLEELVDMLVATGKIKDRRKTIQAVIAREKICTTGFENGVAIPHPREGDPEAIRELAAAFGRSMKGIEFDALDGQPVHIFFLLVAPSTSEHLRALARLARFLRDEDFRDALKEASTNRQVLKAVMDQEKKHG